MNIQIEYIPLGGGLDLGSSALSVKSGKLLQCLNYEQTFGKQGYRRVDGYERVDGRASPSDATYSTLDFTAGTSALVVGATITGASASAKILAITVTAGTLAGSNAVGELVIGSLTGNWTAAENIQVSAVTSGVATAAAVLGSESDAAYLTNIVLAREATRNAIQAVPGSGAVLGVAVFNNTVYAARNDGSVAKLYRSSAAGWVQVGPSLYPGGRFEFDVANFTGTSKTLSLFGCDGKNRPFKIDSSNTMTLMAPIYGSQATSTTSTAIGTGSKTFTVVEATRSWTVGDSLIIWSGANPSNSMTGLVTAYSSMSLTVNVTSSTGSGTATDWEIGKSDFSDKPYLLAAHRDHLFLAYPSGQLQTSNLGDPMVYTTTAALFGLGDDVTGMTSLKGDLLGIFCRSKIHLLSGSAKDSWQMSLHSSSAGAIRGSIQNNVGNAMFWDDRGLTTLQSTLNFGNFEPSIFSRDVSTVLKANRSNLAGSLMARSKYQYRILFSTGTVLTGTVFSPKPQIEPNDVSFTLQKYLHSPSCAASGDFGGSADAMFMGTSDGYVMQLDKGTSFDGEVIDSAYRVHFGHYKSPSSKKRFRKLVFELDSVDPVQINFRQNFDFVDGYYPASIVLSADSDGVGGVWGESSWNTFYWSRPLASESIAHIDGMGKNMGLLVWHSSATDRPFFMQGLLVHFSVLGLQR